MNKSNPSHELHHRRGSVIANVAIAMIIIGAIVVGIIAIVSLNQSQVAPPGKGNSSGRDIPKKLMTWDELEYFEAAVNNPRAIATHGGKIYIAGKEKVSICNEDGREIASLAFDGSAVALDVGDNGLIYIAQTDKIIVLENNGKVAHHWPGLVGQSQFVSIAVASERVFVTDYGRRVVVVYDLAGKKRFQIADKNNGQGGFRLPSAHFEVARGPGNLVSIVNTGATGPAARRIAAYSVAGEKRYEWGMEGQDIESFCGCCNPIAIAFLPNGEIVTAEKTIPTIKVYKPGRDGVLSSVVASKKKFGYGQPKDIAIDSKGRILALVPKTGRIRIFQRK